MSKFHFPIVFKLVFLTSLLVVGVAISIAWKNSELFSQISTDREESSAEMITSSKALEVEAILESYVEKLSLLAADTSKKQHLNGDITFFKLESSLADTIGFELFQAEMTLEQQDDFKQIIQGYKSHAATLQNGNVFIGSTGSMLKDPYLIVGSPVAKENGFVTYWAWGLFKLNRLQASFEGTKNLKIYLLDSTGKVIVHPDEKKTLSSHDLSTSKVVSSLLKDDIRQRQQYLDNILYSSSKTVLGPLVLGEVSQAAIMAPSKLAKETSYFLLGVILSVSFFLSVVFAQTISGNLEKLTAFSHRIAQGDFDIQASKEIKSKDEIGTLAIAFDEMTEGLRERDKIKNIFTKFHGTVITDTLMDQEDLRKGKQCEAVVFFSDIRGFTDFSNHRSPEEVVAMLNSYFEVMVGIITKHGGVVDKFVGDAIMAIWGAPNSSPDDARNAVMACLEMRSALASFNQARIDNGDIPILIGMGLHAGPVVAGTVGSNDRLEYTVIGDTVNTASRIEASTKSFGTDLLISEEVVRRVDERFIVSVAGSTKVKGKIEPLQLAQVSGFYDQDGNPQTIETEYSQYEAEEDKKVKIVA